MGPGFSCWRLVRASVCGEGPVTEDEAAEEEGSSSEERGGGGGGAALPLLFFSREEYACAVEWLSLPLSVAAISSFALCLLVDDEAAAKGRYRPGESSSSSSASPSELSVRNTGFLPRGGLRKAWLREGGSSSEPESDGPSWPKAYSSLSCALPKGLARVCGRLWEPLDPLKARCSGCLPPLPAICLLCVTVVALGVLEISGFPAVANLGVPGDEPELSPVVASAAFNVLIAEGNRGSVAKALLATCPLEVWLSGGAGLGALLVAAVAPIRMTFRMPSKCRSMSQAACWKRKAFETAKRSAMASQSRSCYISFSTVHIAAHQWIVNAT